MAANLPSDIVDDSKDRVDESYGYPFEVKVFSLQSNKWKRIDLLPEDVEILFDNFYFQPLYCRGNGVLAGNRLHWILVTFKGGIAFNTILTFDLATEVVRILSFPHAVYCRGSIEGEWSKFVSVPKPETVESFKFVRPLIYSKDRSKILLEINNGKLFWFDLGSKSLESLVIKGCEGLPCNAEVVVSSLVLGCKGDPRRAQEKKIIMLQKGNKRILDNALPLAKADQHGANFGIANVADDWDDVGIIMISELKETTEVMLLEGVSHTSSGDCTTPGSKRKETDNDLPDITSSTKKTCTNPIKIEKSKTD
ncbi:hypothetical protein Bca4012_016537 [Brassica carinata]